MNIHLREWQEELKLPTFFLSSAKYNKMEFNMLILEYITRLSQTVKFNNYADNNINEFDIIISFFVLANKFIKLIQVNNS